MLGLAADSEEKLKRRARYFCFESARRGRREVREFVDVLQNFGDVTIIGGMLRDLCLSGNKEFASDVDLVINPVSLKEFNAWMGRIGASTNRFGGYGISLQRWKVDVWPLERTWASVNGHHEVKYFEDLLDVTFFDWDAVLFLWGNRKIVTRENYFETLSKRILNINLEPNPNPMGNAVRALRYARIWNASFGYELAEFVARNIKENYWADFLKLEESSYHACFLRDYDLDDLCERLSSFLSKGEDRVFRPYIAQFRFDFLGGSVP